MASALLILRTPLQAHLAHQVISQEGVDEYDLIYLTQQDSPEDRFYFSKFSNEPGLRKYVFVPPTRFDIFNHLKFYWALRGSMRDFNKKIVLIGSVDAPVISTLVRHQKHSTLVSVDDGSANINLNSIYHNPKRSWRYKIYARLLGADELRKVTARIQRHYTLFEGVKNIVEKDRLCYLPTVCPDISDVARNEFLTYFIGQPVPREFRDMITAEVQDALKGKKIDFYVRHPREDEPLKLGAPLLDKKGRIAEEAILRSAAGRDVHIISGFSTATLNLAPFVKSAVVLIQPSIDRDSADEMERVSKLTGCIVRRL